MIDVVTRGYRWNDGEPEPSADESAEIARHARDALIWLDGMVVRFADSRPETTCERPLRAAVMRGALGASIVAKLRLFDVDTRQLLVSMLRDVPPLGSRDALVRLGAEAVDAEVRAAAIKIVQAIDDCKRPDYDDVSK